MSKIEIIDYNKEYLKIIKTIFFLNTPKYFAIHEWNDLLEYLEKHHKTYFLAKKGDTLLGCGGYFKSTTNTARLSWDFLHPNFKGQGIGSKIIVHCLSEIKLDTNIRTIEVYTSQYAYKFYEKFGLKLVEVKEHYWSNNIHLYRMSS